MKSFKKRFIVLGVVLLGLLWGWALSPRLLDGVSFSREIYDRHGQLLRMTLSGDEKYRIWTPLEEINPDYVEAVLLLEDKYFYYHPGFNPVAIFRALMEFQGNASPSGASTVTMQLARVRYGLRTRSVGGKLRQILKALQIEFTHTKSQILEAYLNLVPFGGPVEGIGAASRIYFDKSAKDLTLSEALALAVVPQSPTQRNLNAGNLIAGSKIKNPSLLNARARLLEKWLARYPETKNKIYDLDLPLTSKKIKALPFLAPHFSDMAVRSTAAKKIKSSLDMKLQKRLEDKTKNYLASHRQYGVKNATVLVVNHQTREVAAYIGSADFFNEKIEGQVDGIMAKRSPGSALKPFVYALAQQQGLIHAKTLLKDVPVQFAVYDPENFDQRYMGPVSAEQALILSRNVPAIALSNQLKNPTFYEFLKEANVFLPREDTYYGLSLVLGGTEVSPWEMAHLYSTLANKGHWAPLRWTVDDGDSNKFNFLDNKDEKDLLSSESSFAVLDMLTKVPRPRQNFKKDWVESYYPVAWKTGTSHAFRDAWTVGVAGPYVIVVWFGNFDNTPNPAFVGVELAAPLFFQVVDALADKSFADPNWNSPAGLNLKKVKVCKVSGNLPQAHCPHLEETWYEPGRSPIRQCDIHRALLISKKSGLRSCEPPSENNMLQIFEFWPSDLKVLFERAGLKRQNPPPFEKTCALSRFEGLGHAPQITAPANHVTYLKSLSSKTDLNTMNFRATADGDVKELFWFMNRRFIGKSKSGEPFTHTAEVGDHILSVVDDLGRSDHKKLSVRAVQ